MKKHLKPQILVGIAFVCVTAVPATAQITVQVGIPMPPPIVFAAPPQVVVLPGFDIYVAPDIAEEVYFVDGFWWRPWQGHWYRSHSYNGGWSSYSSVPSFYGHVRHDWRDDYRNHRWEGHSWNYERVPHDRVEQNWSSWKTSNHWQAQNNWGVPEMNGGQRSPQQAPASSRYEEPRHSGSHGHGSSPKASQHHSSSPRTAESQHHSAPAKTASHHDGGQPHANQHAQQPGGGHGAKGSDHGNGGKGGHGGEGDAKHGGGESGQHGGGNGKH
jgi:hypothetical protein